MIPPAARGVAAAPCTPRYRAGPQFKLDRIACHGVASMVAEVGQHLVEAQLQAVDLLFRNPQGRPAGPQPAGGLTKLQRIGIDLPDAPASRVRRTRGLSPTSRAILPPLRSSVLALWMMQRSPTDARPDRGQERDISEIHKLRNRSSCGQCRERQFDLADPDHVESAAQRSCADLRSDPHASQKLWIQQLTYRRYSLSSLNQTYPTAEPRLTKA